MKRNICGDSYQLLRVSVMLGRNGLWSDRVALTYWNPQIRVLERDIIEFIGVVNGRRSMFGDTDIPDITVISLRIEPESE